MSSCSTCIVIPVRDEEALLPRCLDSLEVAWRNAPDNVVGIVVVNNGSKDSTKNVITQYSSRLPIVKYVEEAQQGIGHARRQGASYCLQLAKNLQVRHGFWLINTDADVVVSPEWLHNWDNVLSVYMQGMITGTSWFGEQFATQWPSSYRVLTNSFQFLLYLESLVGVINVDGFNSAIAMKVYKNTGPYPQFYSQLGRIRKPLPGEDWGLSYESFRKGIKITRIKENQLEVSPRRYITNPVAALTGSAYTKPHLRVNVADTLSTDPCAEHEEEWIERYTRHLLSNYFFKPILARPRLTCESAELRNILGYRLAEHLWQELENMLNEDEREGGIENYLKALRVSQNLNDRIGGKIHLALRRAYSLTY